MTPRPFRFAAQNSSPLPDLSWPDTAREVEALGYSALHVADHFGDQYGPIVAMTAAAMATTDLIVGCLVFDNDYRHPVVLAKEMATLAQLAPGRVELGLGAGWMRWDYESAGIPYDAPKVRVDRFEEGLGVIRSLLDGEEVTHAGRHYQLAAMPGRPIPPVRPAIMVGGGGPRMLRIAAQQADIVAITSRIPSGVVDLTSALDSAPARIDDKVQWVRAAAGARFAELDLNCLVLLAVVTDDAVGVANGVAAMFGSDPSIPHGVGASMRAAADQGNAANEAPPATENGFGVDDVLGSPSVLLGTEDEIVQRLLDRRQRWGFNYVTIQGPEAIRAMAPVVARLTGT